MACLDLIFHFVCLAVAIRIVCSNELCNPAVYRCSGNQVAFKYSKRSDCYLTDDAGLNCYDKKTSCICLSVDKVCSIAPNYANYTGGITDEYGLARPTPATTTTGSSNAAYYASPSSTAYTSTPDVTASSTTAATIIRGPPTNDPLCQLPYIDDNKECDAHKTCSPVSGGIALCCSGRCLHVHNVPCVRNFFKKEDQLCSDRDYKRLYHQDLVQDD